MADAASSQRDAADDPVRRAIPPGAPFERAHFARQDETRDNLFYRQPRLVTHIDDAAIAALTVHYADILPARAAVLDLMSSWVSHFPPDFAPSRAAGLGMNAEELAANPRLSEWTVRDLNQDPRLPYDDAAFDAVVIAVSVQYLQQPAPVFREIGRVLRPGGVCAVSFSNLCFPTKAIALWLGTDDATHRRIVAAYFALAGLFDQPETLDLSPSPGRSNPLYVVQARRRRDAPAG